MKLKIIHFYNYQIIIKKIKKKPTTFLFNDIVKKNTKNNFNILRLYSLYKENLMRDKWYAKNYIRSVNFQDTKTLYVLKTDDRTNRCKSDDLGTSYRYK